MKVFLTAFQHQHLLLAPRVALFSSKNLKDNFQFPKHKAYFNDENFHNDENMSRDVVGSVMEEMSTKN
jgi:hypothetical protein